LVDLGPDFILPFPAAAEENLVCLVGNFHFLTEKVNFILPFSLEANFHVTVWSGVRILYYRSACNGTGFHITVPEFLCPVNTGSFARPLKAN
jgi:hypothetical protein